MPCSATSAAVGVARYAVTRVGSPITIRADDAAIVTVAEKLFLRRKSQSTAQMSAHTPTRNTRFLGTASSRGSGSFFSNDFANPRPMVRRAIICTITMAMQKISAGTVHQTPTDLRKALTADRAALLAWEDLTPLARNEWICWVTFVKKDETRKEHVGRVINELKEGIRRPCCWLGCIHRTDKKVSASVRGLLERSRRKSKTE